MNRAEAIVRLKGLYGNGYPEQEVALDMAISALSEEPKKGEWIYNKGDFGYYSCSECHKTRSSLISGEFNFCPNCGADMRGE